MINLETPTERYTKAFSRTRPFTHFERVILTELDHIEDLLMQAEKQLRRAGVIPVYRPKHNVLTLANDN